MDSVSENIEITNQKAFINFMNWAKLNGAIFPDISFFLLISESLFAIIVNTLKYKITKILIHSKNNIAFGFGQKNNNFEGIC